MVVTGIDDGYSKHHSLIQLKNDLGMEATVVVRFPHPHNIGDNNKVTFSMDKAEIDW
jgi:hypothetical protein